MQALQTFAGAVIAFPAMNQALRVAAALLLFSGWMGLLFAGVFLGGAIHLLLVGAAILFPWKLLARA